MNIIIEALPISVMLFIGSLIALLASMSVPPRAPVGGIVINRELLLWNIVGCIWFETMLLRIDAQPNGLIWGTSLIFVGCLYAMLQWMRSSSLRNLSNECKLFAGIPVLGVIFLSLLSINSAESE